MAELVGDSPEIGSAVGAAVSKVDTDIGIVVSTFSDQTYDSGVTIYAIVTIYQLKVYNSFQPSLSWCHTCVISFY